MDASANIKDEARTMQTEMCTATSTPVQFPVETLPGGCPLPESGIDDSAKILLPRPPAAPGGRGYRRRDSILLMQTATQAGELASADATTTKTLDDIEALLASLKSSSLTVSAPSAPATPKPPDMAAAAPSPKVMVKSRFMDVHTNNVAEGGAAPKVRKILRRSSCTALPYHASSGATASDGIEPGSPTEEGSFTCAPLDSPLQTARSGPAARPVGSLAAVRHCRSSLTSGGGGYSAAGPAAVELSSNSLTSGGGKGLLPIKPFPQQQLRQGMAGGMARPPPRRNVSCSLLPSSAAIPMSRASSLMASPRVSSGSSQALGAYCNDDDASDDDDDSVQLAAEASGTSISGRAAAARRGSVFLPGAVGAAAAEPGRSSLPSGLSGAQANMKQPSVSFFANALAIRRASSTAGPGELPQLSLSVGGQLLPSIGVSNCVTQPSTPR